MTFYCLVIFILFQSVKSTVFSVPHELTKLFIAEENIVRLISSDHKKSEGVDEYLLSWRSRFNELIPRLRDGESPEIFNVIFQRLYNDVAIKIEERSEDEYFEAVLERLVGNPVHVYTLLDRLVNMLPWLRAGLGGELDTQIEEIIGSLQVPDDSDMEGACQALVRIQFAYRLDPADMARGQLHGTDTQARLTPGQMMDIARRRQSGQQPLRPHLKVEHALAIIWAEAALSLTEDEDERLEVEMFLGLARMAHNNDWVNPAGKRGNFPNEEFFVRKIEEGDTGLSLREEEKLFLVNATNDPLNNQGFNIHDFYSLCRGEPVAHSCAPARPLCHVSTNQQPYLTLAPLRVETICEEPTLVIFHDILTSKEMAYMKAHVLKDLMVATVVDRSVEGGDGKRVSNERTQSSGWLWDTDHELLNKLSKKTEVFTNLAITPRLDTDPYRTFASEAWQMGLYGSGGHYLPHFDAFDVLPGDGQAENYWVGNRIATVMFYLSDLKGGFTAFPEMGVAAQPRAGSAVFWYNLDRRQQERDARSLHGACPTALGIKWVSNKWIRQGAQIWGKNCPLD